MGTEIDGRIAQANGRLKAGKIGLTIERDGDRLTLRGTLPPKPGSAREKPHQQRIRPGFRANPSGLKAAEAEARKISGLLASREFDWKHYLRTDPAETAGEAIAKFRHHYFQSGGTQTTWDGDYWKALKLLDQDAPLTVEALRELVLRSNPNTKTRRRFAMATGAIAKFVGLEFSPAGLAGNYSPRRAGPRDLPDDATIAKWHSKISNPAWRWIYGVIACYGLRPHEAFRLNFEDWQPPIIEVGPNTKTGSRRVWPCYPDWVEMFRLEQPVLPNIDLTRTNEKVGHSATAYFSEFGLPFKLYDLRHAWAVRTLEFGLDISLAAQQMGHSLQVHSELYHRWISDRHHQRAYEVLMMRPDRPKPPV